MKSIIVVQDTRQDIVKSLCASFDRQNDDNSKIEQIGHLLASVPGGFGAANRIWTPKQVSRNNEVTIITGQSPLA